MMKINKSMRCVGIEFERSKKRLSLPLTAIGGREGEIK